MKTVYILEEGKYGCGNGVAVAAATTKKLLIKWIKENRPSHRSAGPVSYGELFYECCTKRTWLRCDPIDQCPLIQ